MKYKRFIILVISFFVINNVIGQENWTKIGKSLTGRIYYLKTNYVSKDENSITIWEKVFYPSKDYEGKIYKNCFELSLIKFNCGNQQTLILELVLQNAKGVVIFSLKKPDDEENWSNVVPDTIGESVFKNACQMFNAN